MADHVMTIKLFTAKDRYSQPTVTVELPGELSDDAMELIEDIKIHYDCDIIDAPVRSVLKQKMDS